MKQIVVAIISIAVVTITLLVDESASFVLNQQPHPHHMNIIRNARSTIMTMSALSSPPAVPVEKVIVLDDAEAVGKLQYCAHLLLYNNCVLESNSNESW